MPMCAPQTVPQTARPLIFHSPTAPLQNPSVGTGGRSLSGERRKLQVQSNKPFVGISHPTQATDSSPPCPALSPSMPPVRCYLHHICPGHTHACMGIMAGNVWSPTGPAQLHDPGLWSTRGSRPNLLETYVCKSTASSGLCNNRLRWPLKGPVPHPAKTSPPPPTCWSLPPPPPSN